MTYSLSLAPAAVRQFRKLPVLIQQQLRPHIDSLVLVPGPAGTKKMEGEPDLFRLRVGDYRILYYIWDDAREVLVVKIAHRKEAYR